jgi:trimeric autotransporter adhesin
MWLSSLSAITLFAKPKIPQEIGPQPMAVSARYTSPRGIGYEPGYTTLEGFFSWMVGEKWEPFVDLRAHVFDNGKFASNAGLGFRWLTPSRIYGVNGYYDYRKTRHLHYNQAALGFETLGEMWDFRLNGYLPVGKKESHLFGTHFEKFKGHYMVVKSRQEFAMKEVSGEVGLHVDNLKSAPFYFTAGPYYLEGKGASAWGGEVRASVDLFHRHLHLEASCSYDHYFRWIGQGQVSLKAPFGGKRRGKDKMLLTRSVQHVDRQEIIPVGKRHRHTKAIDPMTGQPQYFWFVDNTSHSSGTFESPFPSLVQAQNSALVNQIIYVFPGDLTSTNMDQGIVLQDGQQLLGAANAHQFRTTLGKVTASPQASAQPIVTNNNSAPVVQLANSNKVSGLYIENFNGNGIAGTGITNFKAAYNTFTGGNGGEAILLTDVFGKMRFKGNTYALASSGPFGNSCVHLVQTMAHCEATFSNETYYCSSSGNLLGAIFADLSQTGSISTLSIDNTTLFNVSGASNNNSGIQVSLQDGSFVDTVKIFNVAAYSWVNGIEIDLAGSGSVGEVSVIRGQLNSVPNPDANNAIFVNMTATGSVGSVLLQNSSITGFTNGMLLTNLGSGSVGTCQVMGTNVSDSTYAVLAQLGASGSMTQLDVFNCNFQGNQFGVATTIFGSGGVDNLTVSNCRINGCNGGFGVYAYLNDAGSIGNMVVQNCDLNGNPSSYSVIAYLSNTSSGSIGNLEVSNCTLNNVFNGGGFQVDLLGSGSINNVLLSNSDLGSTQNALYVNLTSTGSIGNFLVSDCTFNNNGGFGITANLPSTGSINQFTVTDSSFNNNLFGIAFSGGGPVNNLSVTGCNFTGSINSGISINTVAVSNLNITDCQFTANNTAALLLPTAPTLNAVMNGNTFDLNIANSLMLTTTTGSNFVSVTQNTYTGIASPGVGYGATIVNNGGALCLEFAGNAATPANIPGGITPYSFTSGAGSFNLTSDSTATNNQGAFTFTGTFGSCSE